MSLGEVFRTMAISIRVAPFAVSTVLAMAILTSCAPRPPATTQPRGPVALSPSPPDPEHIAQCQASAARPAPPAPSFREDYHLPERWTTEDREQLLERALATAGARGDSGVIDEVTLDRAAGTVSVLADARGHERIVLLLGGCVLYGEDAREGWSTAVVALANLSAADGVLASGPPSEGVRVVADVPTNSVVLYGPDGEVARRRALIWTADCLAARP